MTVAVAQSTHKQNGGKKRLKNILASKRLLLPLATKVSDGFLMEFFPLAFMHFPPEVRLRLSSLTCHLSSFFPNSSEKSFHSLELPLGYRRVSWWQPGRERINLCQACRSENKHFYGKWQAALELEMFISDAFF